MERLDITKKFSTIKLLHTHLEKAKAAPGPYTAPHSDTKSIFLLLIWTIFFTT